jgi:valyl-tRNA synthetase
MCTETQDVRMPVEFECPHCQALVEQTKKNRVQPRVECKKCGQPFRTQWANKPEDLALPRGPVVSERFELGRNFCNKLWNAARFALMNLEGYTAGRIDAAQLTLEDRWLLSRLSTVTQQVTESLDHFQFAEAARVLYDFSWNEFCSFYVEMAKPRLQDAATRTTAQRVLAHALDVLIRLLHPLVPFIAEEVWQLLGQAAPQRGINQVEDAATSVVIAPWPVANPADRNAEIEARFGRFQEVLGGLREIRARQNIPPRESIRFVCRCDAATRQLLEPMSPYFASMAGASCDSWATDAQSYANSASFTAAGAEVSVDLADFIDVEAEIARLTKDRERLQQGIANKQRQLGNENFVSRAPAEVIAKERAALAQMEEQLAANATALAALVTKR